jgi:Predicted outer membrane protein
VKQFAQQMVTDHTRMGNEWASLAARSGMRITPALDATQQQEISRLTSLSGADFDRQYMGTMVQDHQLAVSTFQSLGPRRSRRKCGSWRPTGSPPSSST